jgi:hypothetical protein
MMWYAVMRVGYISAHKDDLMSGMQDVATLAERYGNLAQTARKLRLNIDRLKKEVRSVRKCICFLLTRPICMDIDCIELSMTSSSLFSRHWSRTTW